MSATRYLRLLPAVLIVGLAVLVLKGIGLVHDARADVQNDVQVASAQTVSRSDSSAQKNLAGDEAETASAAEVDVLSSLARRHAELDARGRDQDMRENVIAATERRIDAKIAALKQLQSQINQLLGQRDAAQEKQIASLVKTYAAMKPKDAARIFNGLDGDVLIQVAAEMKSDALAPVLAAMNAEAAQKLTVRLASRLNVPDKAALAPNAATTTQPAVPSQVPSPAPMGAPGSSPPAAGPQSAPPQAAAPQAAPPAATHG
jgi:flagellar motility protein MotE (MotC chaperone)